MRMIIRLMRYNMVARPWIRYCSSSNNHHWEARVGLEVHAQINTSSKLFSPSPVRFYAAPNTLVSHIDAALPGTLPALNRQCVKAGVATALALSFKLNRQSYFDRKHYFYSDLPAGYQITQQRVPLGMDGKLTSYVLSPRKVNHLIDGGHMPRKSLCVRLKQIHLEQDSGRSIYDTYGNQTLIDLNRAGIGLMEIVTESDFACGQEAVGFVKELQAVLQSLDTCNGHFEEGAIRVDANVSINRPGDPFGTRTEIKNISGLRSLGKAIDYEIQRQIEHVQSGGKIIHETRGFDEKSGSTLRMRDKEGRKDYRYMPEPDLPPLVLMFDEDRCDIPNDDPWEPVNIATILKSMPKLPAEIRSNLMNSYGISLEEAFILHEEDGIEYFKTVMSNCRYGSIAASWATTELLGLLRRKLLNFNLCPISGSEFGSVMNMIGDGEISTATAKKVIRMIILDEHQMTPTEIIAKENLTQMNDIEVLSKLCDEILNSSSAKALLKNKAKKNPIGYLIGQVLKQTKGRANPTLVNQIITEKVEKL